MHEAQSFLLNLALVLGVAAISTVVFQRLHQPVVLGYLIAGLLIGPHVPIPLVADEKMVHALSELGVILLMFSIGLEFSLGKLARVAKTGGLIAVIEVSAMISIGYSIGRAFGWSVQQSIFTGAIIAISSTTIIAKAFREQRCEQRITELVFGVLVAEDLLAILLVTALTAVSTGTGLSPSMLALTIGKLLAFLIGVIGVGLFVIPRFMRFVVALNRPETTVVAAVGLCFSVALLAHHVGYSVALGAFLAGSLVSESGEAKEIEHLVEPVRDVFGAIFFVSVGMLINPALIVAHWPAIALLTAVVLLGKIAGVTAGAFLSGSTVRDSVQAGMCMSQIGEFSFIIAGVGLALGATDQALYPIAVTVSAITTMTTPWMVRFSAPASMVVERYMPKRLHAFASFYATWILRLREDPHDVGFGRQVRRLAKLIVLDATALVAVVIGASMATEHVAMWIVLVAAPLAAAPFVIGFANCARSLGTLIAAETVRPRLRAASPDAPKSDSSHTTIATPAVPRALVVTFQLAVVLVVATPVVAITSAFLPKGLGFAAYALLVITLGLIFWRRTSELETQVRAGIEVVMDLLAKQTHVEKSDPQLEQAVQQAMPWFGTLHTMQIDPQCVSIGRTLAEINLRGRTGASCVAIRRGDHVLMPSADEAIEAGDILALAGSPTAMKAAEIVLGMADADSDRQTEMLTVKRA